MAENRRIDVFLRHGWEGRLLSLIGKSKLLLIVLIHWYGVQGGIRQFNSCLLSAGAVLIVPVKILHLKQQLWWESPPDEVYNS